MTDQPNSQEGNLMDMKHRYPSINLVATGKRIAQLRKERGLSVRDMQTTLGLRLRRPSTNGRTEPASPR